MVDWCDGWWKEGRTLTRKISICSTHSRSGAPAVGSQLHALHGDGKGDGGGGRGRGSGKGRGGGGAGAMKGKRTPEPQEFDD